LLPSRGGDDGLGQDQPDVKLYASVLDSGKQVSYELADGRHAWIQVKSGAIDVNGHTLTAGDGARDQR
jgi:redox-sensitive bicupin YhaK (pirin superfamily)